jgi:hypothetical protein
MHLILLLLKSAHTLKLLPSNKPRMPSMHLSNTSNVYHYLSQWQKLLMLYHLASKDLKMYLRLIWATTLPVANMTLTVQWLQKGQRVCLFTNTYPYMSLNLTLCRKEVSKHSNHYYHYIWIRLGTHWLWQPFNAYHYKGTKEEKQRYDFKPCYINSLNQQMCRCSWWQWLPCWYRHCKHLEQQWQAKVQE